jgi:hypothetical protein
MSPPGVAAVIPDGSALLRWSFVVLSVFIGGSFALGVRWSALRSHLTPAVANRQSCIAAVGAALWLAVTGVAAASGILQFEPPSTMLGALVVTFAVGIGVGLSPVGGRLAVALPVAALVGFQGFRVVVELLMHRAYSEGLMPVQMSYSGRNFDIVTGLTALALGAWLAAGRTSRRLVFAWNTLGVALLLNVLVVALLSAPTPFRIFMTEPANVWVTRAPWIWLPTVMVMAAVIGHVLVYRRLWIESQAVLPRTGRDRRAGRGAPRPQATDDRCG